MLLCVCAPVLTVFFILCTYGAGAPWSSVVQGRVPLATAEQRANEEEVVEKTTTQMYRAPEMVDLYLERELTEKVDVWVSLILLTRFVRDVVLFAESQKATTFIHGGIILGRLSPTAGLEGGPLFTIRRMTLFSSLVSVPGSCSGCNYWRCY